VETREYYVNKAGRRVPRTRMRGWSDEARFEVTGYTEAPNGCWVWNGRKNDKGYGVFIWSGGQLAHRYSFESNAGRKITEGTSMMHSCDNRPCVNPSHLSEGTHAENMAQARDRDRFPQRKLTREQVLQVVEFESIESRSDMAARFGVSSATIKSIQLGRSWSWLTDRGNSND